MKVKKAPLYCKCEARYFKQIFEYKKPPEGEIRFGFSSKGQYWREVHQCGLCGHMVSIHEMDMESLYSSQYMDSTYKDMEGVSDTFERIVSLPQESSDNASRVARIVLMRPAVPAVPMTMTGTIRCLKRSQIFLRLHAASSYSGEKSPPGEMPKDLKSRYMSTRAKRKFGIARPRKPKTVAT